MPRGGAREGAGKPSSWSSGCKYEDTKLIRVPKAIASKVLELAHKVDEGTDYEIVTKSLQEDNQKLRSELEKIQKSFKDLELAQSKVVDNDELIIKSKELLFDESLVRSRDRSPVKKLLSQLFGIDKSYYDKK